MKSRIALIAVLATGIVMSTTGATLAVTGIAGDNDASVAQYGGVLGSQTASGNGGGGGGGGGGNDSANGPGTSTGDSGDTLGESTTGSSDPAGSNAGARATQQVAAGDSRLPFTGLAVFPLLIGGVALLLTGTFMRRQARTDAV